eukprot:CAMPEP_0196766602 /NCGR_PEP_ID=MMETSP1095-20130614/27218_1 /TAXON_ID=96789 ORGANISM="Chromulina nebulosa, Strain UTEXLB2642" /NCGR_SAMPLE_ID=MMETSP1095 /ASSEMBLY_ACC=CAM_ASM_000446 /LENGTH=805 /DNA_ID=CAMNT_0042129537 /DNA_START=178 /DNA_END=2592 /DNA_ORIENTATION=-
MVEQTMNNASTRQKHEEIAARKNRKQLPDKHSTTIKLVDLIGQIPNPQSSEHIQKLMKMTGLQDVKNSVQSLMQMFVENYKSELNGEGIIEISLHRMFYGNPGTGKTTVASIYGKILCEMGILSNGEVVVVGASKLIGSAVGTTAKTVNDIIDSIYGKVLVIDEAYVLGRSNSIYGAEALDTLVERVQGNPGENFVVILCGYEDEMKAMIRDGNPGLRRRFKEEDSFYFKDYSDDELVEIILKIAPKKNLYITDELAIQAVKKILSLQRSKAHFGNVGAVENLLSHAVESMNKRGNATKKDGLWIVLPDDLFISHPENSAEEVLSRMTNIENIKTYINNMKKRINSKIKSNQDPKQLLKNYLFIGSPGTGKTTVARAFGEIFHKLGLLGRPEVTECKAMDLIGQYVGHSSAKVKSKMDEARGGVLFIDEAYGLNPSSYGGNSFAKDAIEMLLSNMTDSKYQGNMIIILAGYANEMSELMKSNPGLKSRVTETMSFNDWNSDNCLDLIIKKCKDNNVNLPNDLYDQVKRGFSKLAMSQGWGNARDVLTFYDKIEASRADRCNETDESTFFLTDIENAFKEMNQTLTITSSKISLDSLINADKITTYINEMKNRLKVTIKNKKDTKGLLENYVFVGSPGTGKTTVARLFGEIFNGLGLLGRSDVIECKAMDLIGQYLGHSSKIVQQKMDDARGGILFIDEAYGLNSNNSSFAKDAIETLLANMTDPRYQDNMVIIIAGYSNEMNDLLQSNPGLTSRFTEKIEFEDFRSEDCMRLILQKCSQDDSYLPEELHPIVLDRFNDLSLRLGW